MCGTAMSKIAMSEIRARPYTAAIKIMSGCMAEVAVTNTRAGAHVSIADMSVAATPKMRTPKVPAAKVSATAMATTATMPTAAAG